MAVYFVDRYSDLYNKINNEKSIAEYYAALESSVNEISSEIGGVMELLEEFEGNYTKELQVNLSNFLIETRNSYEMLGKNLNEKISVNIPKLSGDLKSFKTEDEKLEGYQEDLSGANQLLDAANKAADSPDKESAILSLSNSIVSLNDLIEACRNVIIGWRAKCDKNIESLDEFNDDIVDIRLKMASVAAMNDGYSLEDLEKMTPEEKTKLIEELVEKMTERYNSYKKAYEEYFNKILEDPESINTLYGLYRSVTQDFSYDIFDVDPDHSVPSGLHIAEFVVAMGDCKTKNGKSLIDCISDYNNGKSWRESGMAELYQMYRDDCQYHPEYDEVYEDAFRSDWGYDYNSEPTTTELFNNAVDYYKNNLVPNLEEYKKNYDSAVETGVAVQGLKELKGHVKYDAFTETDDFKNKTDLLDDYGDFCNKVFIESSIDISKTDYMTNNELKMLRYLYENKGIESAEEYMNSINQSLNRRKGYINASNCYYDLISGSNSGIEAVGDSIKIGVIGYGDGIRGFVDGFVDLVAPSRELSADEYAQTALLGYMTDGGSSYDNTLLTAYNIGSVAGQKTIPTILNLVKPGLGKISEKISNFGNSLEDYMRADDTTTYGNALLHTAYDFAIDEGIDKLTAGMGGSKWFKAGAGLTKGLMKDLGNTEIFGTSDKINFDKHLKNAFASVAEESLKGKAINYSMLHGFSENAIKTGEKIFSPAVSIVSKSVVDGVETAAKGGNFINSAEATFGKELGGTLAKIGTNAVDYKYGKK